MSKKRETIRTLTAVESKRYFICGTVGELTVSAEVGEIATFELIPEEQMRVIRKEKDGHLWLSGEQDAEGHSHAVVCDGEMATIEFSPSCENLLRMLIAAKVNSLAIRVTAKDVSKSGDATLTELSFM